MSIMQLKQISDHLIDSVQVKKKRALYESFSTSNDYMTVLIGERGVGKTTLLLQFLKESPLKGFYFSADSQLVTDLFSLIYELYFTHGIRLLVVDEIHKGKDRIQVVKNVVDQFPELHFVISGSSSLDIYKGTAPLARRSHIYTLHPLSFREFCLWYKNINLPLYTFEELLKETNTISFEYGNKFSKALFDEYLQQGMYPYAEREKVVYQQQLRRNLSKTILEDLPTFLNMQSDSIHKIEKLFFFLAHTPPSELHYSGLSKKLGFAKERLEVVIRFLYEVGVVRLAVRSNKLNDIVRKEYKMFLGNPNIYFAYSDTPSSGTIRESYVMSVLSELIDKSVPQRDLILPTYGDIAFSHKDERYIFEVGGKHKDVDKYIAGEHNRYLVKDTMSSDHHAVIPLWQFGLVTPGYSNA